MTAHFSLVTPLPTARFHTMTKDLVDALLALNTKNRDMREAVVEGYQRAIASGFWVPTNQGIGVAAEGFLIDGQHRLEALKASGYPAVVMLVVTGLPAKAMAAVDGGVNRAPRDYLKLLFDTKISIHVAGILRCCMMAADGFPAIKYQPQEYANALERLGDSISAVLEQEHTSKLPAAVVSGLVDAYYKGYTAEVKSFTKALATGEMLEKDNPALLLRNWLNSHRGLGGSSGMIERYRKTTRALQAWVDQRPLAKLCRNKAPISPAKSVKEASNV